jgi:hypothetical protein
MLRKEFDIIHIKFKTWLFERTTSFLRHREFGIKSNGAVTDLELYLLSELLEYVQITNKTINPNSTLVIPGQIGWEAFNRAITNVKNKIL